MENKHVESLLLVDGHALAFHSWLTSYPNSVGPGFLERLAAKIGDSTSTGLAIAFDPPPPTFRHHLYPEYKGNRPVPPVRFLEECSSLRTFLESNGIPVWMVPGYEADDVLGTLSRKASINGIRSLIYTCDLDLLQLVDKNTSVEVFSQYWPTRFFDRESSMRRFHGIKPANLPDLKALMGDRSDSLPGVPGIGEKSATTILTETISLENLYSNQDVISTLQIRGQKRLMNLLIQYKEDAELMKRLATICKDVPFEVRFRRFDPQH